ncbi:MAG: dTDP-4-dehydrorhamnose 3,5-epimerase [bacterium]|nr:dTDP-4-dehydrorhamnose 3,5-epimerase [bacterium]
MPFEFEPQAIPEVILVRARAFPDPRGYFMESYRMSQFAASGIPQGFLQDNFSRSTRSVLRGLHYQKTPYAQGKLVMVLRGEIFDVAVDIRRGSPTFGRWVGVILSDENHTMLYVPEGFAHGFCALTDEADVLYKVTAEYAPEYDRGIRWDDPDLAISWPVAAPVLSEKDARMPALRDADIDFVHGGDT